MYKTLLNVPVTAFVFLSGLMVSVATSAAAQVAFATEIPPNRKAVLASGAVAFGGGVLWYILSEMISGTLRRVDALAPAMKSRESALASLPMRSGLWTTLVFASASILSLLWPWTAQLGSTIYRVYRYLCW